MGEEQAGIAQILVQLLARDARLHAAVAVLAIDLKHLVHAAEIYGKAALHRADMPFEGCAGSEGNDRQAEFGADAVRGADLLRRQRKGHRVGRRHREIVFAPAVLLANGIGRGQPVAEHAAQRGDSRIVADGRSAHCNAF